MKLVGTLERLLFISGEDGLSLSKIVDILKISPADALELIKSIQEEFKLDKHGILLEQFGDVYKFVTKKENNEYIKEMVECEENSHLSQSALEILAIVAYNEPITRSSIDEIRGVNSSYGVRKLLLKELIKEVGKSDLPGRPTLYGTTDRFLDYFGLTSKKDLPNLKLIDNVDIDETNLFESKYRESIGE